MIVTNKITTRTAEISYNPISRIVTMRILDDADIELADALQNHEAVKMLTKTDRYLVLVDGRVNLSVSRDARAFSAEARESCIATAFLITSTANKLIGNFYINFNRPSIPTRIFSTEEKAIEWLQELLYMTESSRHAVTESSRF